MRTPNVELRPTDTLDISADDAARVSWAMAKGVRPQPPRRRGRSGATRPGVKPGELFATFHAADVFLNRLTSPHRDNVVMTPEYKVVAVRIERLAANEVAAQQE